MMNLIKKINVICCLLIANLFAVNLHSQNADINILRSINPENPSSRFWKSTSKTYIILTGTATLGSLACGLIRNDHELKNNAYETLLGVGINIIVTDAMKVIFDRTRPADEYPADIVALSGSEGHSFPSGHTSVAFATATSFSLIYKKWWIVVPAYLWAGCVGYSRMYLGKHYPSDVLMGALVGTGSSLLSHWLRKKIFPQKISKTQP